MLSDVAKSVGLVLREHVGPRNVGVGPDRSQLLDLFSHLESRALRRALDELAGIGFIHIEEVLAVQAPGIPSDFWGIAAVSILEPLQQYYDGLAL